MFSKSKINDPAPKEDAAKPAAPTTAAALAPSAPKAKPPASVLSQDLHVTGKIKTTGDIQVEGTVEGDIRAHLLTIGETATIKEAYERIGIQGVSGYQLKGARRSLNIMFQEWANRGLHYWEIGNNSITLVDGQATYTIYRSIDDGTSDATAIYGVDDILEASYRNASNVDTPLTKINRSTYQALANKTSEGTPSQYFVQRFIDKITITLYLTPGSSEAGKFLNFYYVNRIQDAGAYTNDVDVPYRFVPCMIAGLAYYLGVKFAPERVQMLKMLYEDELNRALTEDGSSSSSYITPKTYYPNV